MRTARKNFVPVRRLAVYIPPSIRDGYKVDEGEPEPMILGRYMIWTNVRVEDGEAVTNDETWFYSLGDGREPWGLGELLSGILADWNVGTYWEALPTTPAQRRAAESNIGWRKDTRAASQPRTYPRERDQG